MRLVIEENISPFKENLIWFANKDFDGIVTSQDDNSKQQLKYNALSIITKANSFFKDKIYAWAYFKKSLQLIEEQEKKNQTQTFGLFFKSIIRLALSDSTEFGLQTSERIEILTFFNYAFNSIEVDFVKRQIQRCLPMTIWKNLSETRRDQELSRLTWLRVQWQKIELQQTKLGEKNLKERTFEREFVYNYLLQFLSTLQSVITEQTSSTKEATDNGDQNKQQQQTDINSELALYCLKFIEFVIDLESQLPLRRFFHALLDYTYFLVRCKLSPLARHRNAEGYLFSQLLELLSLYKNFEINIETRESYSDIDLLKEHEKQVQRMQKILWKDFEELKEFALTSVQAIDNRRALSKIVSNLRRPDQIFQLLKSTGIADDQSLQEEDRVNVELMAEIFISHYERKESQLRKINSIPLLPSEYVIWDTNLVPDKYYNYEYPLALPKLNLQFITTSDYLLRNFMLFKNESTFEIRQDLEEWIMKSKCKWNSEGKFITGPKQRMSLIIKDFSILEIGKPKLGESCPSKVRAKVVINMDYVRPDWRREWEQLRKHDICFLVSFKRPESRSTTSWPEGSFPHKVGIKFVRGCEIEALLDSEGKIVDENIEAPTFKDNIRTYIVYFDCNQYKIDQNYFKQSGENVYEKFHLIVRRKPEQNNFKGVLETIKSLINTKFVVPDWLNDLLLGFGDPSEAHYSNVKSNLRQQNNCNQEEEDLDYFDTFLNFEHLESTFRVIRPDYRIQIHEACEKRNMAPPFRIKFKGDNTSGGGDDKCLVVSPYKLRLRGPYPTVIPKKNSIRFTPAQVEAITSGLQPGLTMVVGPPGTGKTDVAVQILSCLYHTYPNQRTLIVTHSNQALNQIFEKMIELDVEEHHLLRLGHGEEDLQSTKDFSRRGRVNHVLRQRREYLKQVEKLAKSLDLQAPTGGFTCESAEYFHFYHILPRWESYVESLKGVGSTNVSDIQDKFPFNKFFSDVEQLFKGESLGDDFETSKGCYRYIKKIFDHLQAFRPFEIFSNASDRSKYLLIKEAKVIAMTCTHAGLRRKELVEMNFQYDNILMEESAQILEIETTIPLLLQNPENGVNRLKRFIMIGDHNQLPPIIQNSAFQKFSNMEQSLFARFVRLKVPTIELDAQGRARPSIADLYRWRYSHLTELPLVTQRSEFKLANAGFKFDYQIINVPDYKSEGETQPSPHYFVNRGEAEFVLAVFRYMRMLNYPANKISILTTYNGQKQLIRDLVVQYCTKDAFMGRPAHVTTVDKFQGMQNDYILLSLVRTRAVGHLRDIRRLVVAMSRARLGLYVFARVNLFSESLELRPSMGFFLSRPQAMMLIEEEEVYPTKRLLDEQVADDKCRLVHGLDDMMALVESKYGTFVERQTRIERALADSATDDDDDYNAHARQLD